MKLLRIDLYVDNRKMQFFPELAYETGRHVAAVKPRDEASQRCISMELRSYYVTLNLSKAITLPKVTTDSLDYNERTPRW